MEGSESFSSTTSFIFNILTTVEDEIVELITENDGDNQNEDEEKDKNEIKPTEEKHEQIVELKNEDDDKSNEIEGQLGKEMMKTDEKRNVIVDEEEKHDQIIEHEIEGYDEEHGSSEEGGEITMKKDVHRGEIADEEVKHARIIFHKIEDYDEKNKSSKEHSEVMKQHDQRNDVFNDDKTGKSRDNHEEEAKAGYEDLFEAAIRNIVVAEGNRKDNKSDKDHYSSGHNKQEEGTEAHEYRKHDENKKKAHDKHEEYDEDKKEVTLYKEEEDMDVENGRNVEESNRYKDGGTKEGQKKRSRNDKAKNEDTNKNEESITYKIDGQQNEDIKTFEDDIKNRSNGNEEIEKKCVDEDARIGAGEDNIDEEDKEEPKRHCECPTKTGTKCNKKVNKREGDGRDRLNNEEKKKKLGTDEERIALIIINKQIIEKGCQCKKCVEEKRVKNKLDENIENEDIKKIGEEVGNVTNKKQKQPKEGCSCWRDASRETEEKDKDKDRDKVESDEDKYLDMVESAEVKHGDIDASRQGIEGIEEDQTQNDVSTLECCRESKETDNDHVQFEDENHSMAREDERYDEKHSEENEDAIYEAEEEADDESGGFKGDNKSNTYEDGKETRQENEVEAEETEVNYGNRTPEEDSKEDVVEWIMNKNEGTEKKCYMTEDKNLRGSVENEGNNEGELETEKNEDGERISEEHDKQDENGDNNEEELEVGGEQVVDERDSERVDIDNGDTSYLKNYKNSYEIKGNDDGEDNEVMDFEEVLKAMHNMSFDDGNSVLDEDLLKGVKGMTVNIIEEENVDEYENDSNEKNRVEEHGLQNEEVCTNQQLGEEKIRFNGEDTKKEEVYDKDRDVDGGEESEIGNENYSMVEGENEDNNEMKIEQYFDYEEREEDDEEYDNEIFEQYEEETGNDEKLDNGDERMENDQKEIMYSEENEQIEYEESKNIAIEKNDTSKNHEEDYSKKEKEERHIKTGINHSKKVNKKKGERRDRLNNEKKKKKSRSGEEPIVVVIINQQIIGKGCQCQKGVEAKRVKKKLNENEKIYNEDMKKIHEEVRNVINKKYTQAKEGCSWWSDVSYESDESDEDTDLDESDEDKDVDSDERSQEIEGIEEDQTQIDLNTLEYCRKWNESDSDHVQFEEDNHSVAGEDEDEEKHSEENEDAIYGAEEKADYEFDEIDGFKGGKEDKMYKDNTNDGKETRKESEEGNSGNRTPEEDSKEDFIEWIVNKHEGTEKKYYKVEDKAMRDSVENEDNNEEEPETRKSEDGERKWEEHEKEDENGCNDEQEVDVGYEQIVDKGEEDNEHVDSDYGDTSYLKKDKNSYEIKAKDHGEDNEVMDFEEVLKAIHNMSLYDGNSVLDEDLLKEVKGMTDYIIEEVKKDEYVSDGNEKNSVEEHGHQNEKGGTNHPLEEEDIRFNGEDSKKEEVKVVDGGEESEIGNENYSLARGEHEDNTEVKVEQYFDYEKREKDDDEYDNDIFEEYEEVTGNDGKLDDGDGTKYNAQIEILYSEENENEQVEYERSKNIAIEENEDFRKKEKGEEANEKESEVVDQMKQKVEDVCSCGKIKSNFEKKKKGKKALICGNKSNKKKILKSGNKSKKKEIAKTGNKCMKKKILITGTKSRDKKIAKTGSKSKNKFVSSTASKSKNKKVCRCAKKKIKSFNSEYDEHKMKFEGEKEDPNKAIARGNDNDVDEANTRRNEDQQEEDGDIIYKYDEGNEEGFEDYSFFIGYSFQSSNNEESTFERNVSEKEIDVEYYFLTGEKRVDKNEEGIETRFDGDEREMNSVCLEKIEEVPENDERIDKVDEIKRSDEIENKYGKGNENEEMGKSHSKEIGEGKRYGENEDDEDYFEIYSFTWEIFEEEGEELNEEIDENKLNGTKNICNCENDDESFQCNSQDLENYEKRSENYSDYCENSINYEEECEYVIYETGEEEYDDESSDNEECDCDCNNEKLNKTREDEEDENVNQNERTDDEEYDSENEDAIYDDIDKNEIIEEIFEFFYPDDESMETIEEVLEYVIEESDVNLNEDIEEEEEHDKEGWREVNQMEQEVGHCYCCKCNPKDNIETSSENMKEGKKALTTGNKSMKKKVSKTGNKSKNKKLSTSKNKTVCHCCNCSKNKKANKKKATLKCGTKSKKKTSK